MNILKTLGKVLLVIVAFLAVFYLFMIIYLSLRYSPEYMKRELFHELDNVYSYRYYPERKLSASPETFTFESDTCQEPLVEEAFQSGPAIDDLDAFLENTGTQAFLVIQDDQLIYERYFKDLQRDSMVTSFSVAKSFTSALIGIAIQEGYIKSVDDPVTNYIPELVETRPALQGYSDLRSLDDGIRAPVQPLVRRVMETLSAEELEMRDREGHWHLLRIRPYRTADNRIEGTVLALIDIDQLRRAREFAESVVESVKRPLLVLRSDLRVRMANRSFRESYSLQPAEIQNQLLFDIGRGQWHIPALRNAWSSSRRARKPSKLSSLNRSVPDRAGELS